ncbi:reverse transcriptase domain-containing protein [Sabulicella glaciei]|uniref:RNA-directed DNA polymerase n=1 Tax=Sabulicella glaciei TaxID=2984948 RepID=A0ABT3P1G4_9PROT|nr:reverse transcriptase domain-containing protein [Roseococcus sp. MDT2-1-1]MCW8088243.1 reverse transcriptase domain-containing protein [Roseococcus sp. MDT2-1-1]
MSAQIVRAMYIMRIAWRDWRGDLVFPTAHFLKKPSHTDIPSELANEVALLAYLDMSQAELNKIWWYRRRMYTHFEISKRPGKSRLISAPDRRLKHLQRKIAGLLDKMYRRRNPVHGFIHERSVKTNALSHIDSKYILNVDLENFFPTITENRVAGVLAALGIDIRVSDVIARLCCNDGHLPQGAPSSPVLSNMICFRLDRELLAVAKGARCIYTRYADDLSFSSYQPLALLFEAALPPSGRISPDLLKSELRAVIEGNGFKINPAKAHYADRHSRRIVTGLKINEALNVDRKFVRNIRAALYSVEKNGDEKAQEIFAEKSGSTASLPAHLRGKIAWLGNIKGRSDPIFRSMAERFNRCYPARPINLEPTREEIIDRAVWIIEDSEGAASQGSAFFLRDVGLVTAAHCVEGIGDLVVYHPSKPSNKFAVKIKNICSHRDLAVLEHEIASTEYYGLLPFAGTVSHGNKVQAVGYPSYGHGDKINIRPGSVSSLTIKSLVQKIEVTQQLSQGMSGGPIINDKDEVIGITHKGGPSEPKNLAIHIKVLTEWLSSGSTT